MEKVLVTGGSGFLGGYIADALMEKGYQVVIFDREKYAHLQPDQEMILGDICDAEAVAAAVKGCDYVYHLAAEADIGASARNPDRTLALNVGGTLNVLNACLEHQIKRLFFASTIYVYSELGSFYRISKQTCEKLIEEYAREFGLRYCILRFGSLYGPRANYFNGIHKILIQALAQGRIVRQGDGEDIREYIHVRDAADLCVKLMDPQYENTHLIITGPQRLKVKDLLTLINEIFNNRLDIVYQPGMDKHHYKITPYSYTPQVARRITPESYFDMGQGILEVIEEIQRTREENPNMDHKEQK